jgi:hypothetical protein
MEQIGNRLTNMRYALQDNLKDFSRPNLKESASVGLNKLTSRTSSFWQSNSMVAKVAFLLLVLIVVLVILRLCVGLIAYMLAPSSNPYLVKGLMNGRRMRVISQSPNIKGAIPVLRSVDERKGIEFTWSCWVFIDDIHYRANQYRHIFHKGNDDINMTSAPIGMNFPNNAPGLYIAPNKNDLVVIMNTFKTIKEEIVIEDIPINKWMNVIIRCQNTLLDIYLNGNLIKRHKLSGVPKQNYGDVYVAMNGGFSGYLSNLRYHNESLSLKSIKSIVSDGPNLKTNEKTDIDTNNPPYLSLKWIFTGNSKNVNEPL